MPTNGRTGSIRGRADRIVGLLLLLLLPVLAPGCMVGPDYVTPKASVNDAWMASVDLRVKTDAVVESEWWKVFRDPVLDSLIEEAHRQNLSLQAAAMRVLQSMAQRGIAIGELFPQSQAAYGSYSRSKASENPGPPAPYSTSYGIGFDADWELDLWGKLRRQIESADASIDASLASYDDVMVTLVSEVAATYVQIRTLEQRIVIARKNVEIQEKSLDLATLRFKAGASSELDVAQGKSALARTRSTIPVLRAELTQALRTLDVLLGTAPRNLEKRLAARSGIPKAPIEIAVGIPADLLRRRPDIRLAERQAAAQSAQIGVAVADFYPALSLSGSLGYAAGQSSDLFKHDSWTGVISPGFSWALLNYGRIRNNVRVQDAAFQEAVLNYQNSVLAAAQEVESTLATFFGSAKQARFIEESLTASKRSLELSSIQYREGSCTFTRVLNSQASLAAAADTLASTRGQVATNLIAAHKALGGGWEIRAGLDIVPESLRQEMKERTNWGDLLDPDYAEGSDLFIERHDPDAASGRKEN